MQNVDDEGILLENFNHTDKGFGGMIKGEA